MRTALIMTFAVLALAGCAKNGKGKPLKFIPDASDFPHPTDPDTKPTPPVTPPRPTPPPLLSLTNNLNSIQNSLKLNFRNDAISSLTYTTVDGRNQKSATYSIDDLRSLNGVILEGSQSDKQLILKAQFNENADTGSMTFIFPHATPSLETTCRVGLRKKRQKWTVLDADTRQPISRATVVRNSRGDILTIQNICKSADE